MDSLNVNLALWNVIRIMYPQGKPEADEEAAFQAAKASFELHQQLRRLMLPPADDNAPALNRNFHVHVGENPDDRRRYRVEIHEGVNGQEEIEILDDDVHSALESDPDDAAADDDDENPWVVRVETLEAEELRIRRNIVVDQQDENTDGHLTMRNAFGIVEFPSILEAYADDGQDCLVALLQLEEDEEQTEGFPVFMAESGEDDRLVLPQYFGDVRLTVCSVEDPRELVLSRTTSGSHGMIEFKNLRLHVPAGEYVFRIEDVEREVFIEIMARIVDGGGGGVRGVAGGVLDARQQQRERALRARRFVQGGGMDRPQHRTLHRYSQGDYSEDDMMYEGEENTYDSDDSFLASEDEDTSSRRRRRQSDEFNDAEDLNDNDHVGDDDSGGDDSGGDDIVVDEAGEVADRHAARRVDGDDEQKQDEYDEDQVVVVPASSMKRRRRQVDSSSSEEEEEEDMSSVRPLQARKRRRYAIEDASDGDDEYD
ncbi:hypothetical protein DYB31_000916 [Aphanomyces astaci]|uniref:Uncharacterized protein n=1 Tax=Aphanomyces astaci TaxID=112090 RepID=A0A397EN07_APHAT|nr:hypothetical protein DYB31_000916 [Aphanomyces astaci]